MIILGLQMSEIIQIVVSSALPPTKILASSLVK